MKTNEELKSLVRDKYAAIAKQSADTNAQSCCGVGGCATVDYTIFSERYEHLEGYVADADLGLGCGLPTAFAGIKAGDTVVDLGSGAGNDCFVAQAITGPTGKVIGLDMTDVMVQKARENAAKLGLSNVEFRKGDIEQMPIDANRADVVISNCVLNLVPDKAKAFSEIYRILKPGGHFAISDVVIEGQLPPAIQHAAELYAGCVSGAMDRYTYLGLIEDVGFQQIQIAASKQIVVPDEVWNQFLSPEEIENFKSTGTGIWSMTVTASKPDSQACCQQGSGCC